MLVEWPITYNHSNDIRNTRMNDMDLGPQQQLLATMYKTTIDDTRKPFDRYNTDHTKRRNLQRSGSGLLNDIQSFKNKIDDFKFRRSRNPADKPINPLRVDADTIQYEIIDKFNSITSRENFDGVDLNGKIDIIWSYMVIDEYLAHWANESCNKDGKRKAQYFTNNRAQFSSALNKTILHLNKSNHTFMRKDACQKIMHIQAILPRFEAKLDEMTRQKLEVISDQLLAKVRMYACKRSHQDGSMTESRINAIISQTLESQPTLTAMPHKGVFIDFDTSCELDCPIVDERIAFETDGDRFHTIEMGQGQRVHDPVHHFKALALREQGWHRVAIVAETVDVTSNGMPDPKVVRLAQSLQIPTIKAYTDSFNKMIEMQIAVRNKIKQFKGLIAKASQNETRAAAIRQLNDLYALENNIRAVVQARSLERLLISVFEGYPLNEKRVDQVKTINQQLSKIASNTQLIAEVGEMYEAFKHVKRDIIERARTGTDLEREHCPLLLNYLQQLEEYLPKLDRSQDNYREMRDYTDALCKGVEIKLQYLNLHMMSDAIVNYMDHINPTIQGKFSLDALNAENAACVDYADNIVKEILNNAHARILKRINQSNTMLQTSSTILKQLEHEVQKSSAIRRHQKHEHRGRQDDNSHHIHKRDASPRRDGAKSRAMRA